MTVSVWKSGLLSRCPNCGQSPLFEGLLKIRDQCPSCQADLSVEDSGDGPAVFVILVAGAICVPLILILELILRLPIWALILISIPIIVGVCLALLRPFKAMLFAMQWRYRAGEGRAVGGESRE